MNGISFILTLSLAAVIAAIGIALAPGHRKLIAIVSVIGLSAIAASAPALADFSSNPSGHTHPSPQLSIGAYTMATPAPTCSWTDNTHISLSFSNVSSWASTQIQRWSNAPPFANLSNVAAGTTTYSDAVTAGTQYDYQMYGNVATNWVSPTSSTLTSNTCTNAVDTIAGPIPTAEIRQSYGLAVNSTGDIAIADTGGNYIQYVPKYTGSYFGQNMTANQNYYVLGTGTAGTSGDNVAQLGNLSKVNAPQAVAFDSHGNIVVADTGGHEIRVIAASTGTYYGISMTVGRVYSVAGTAGASGDGTSGAATSAALKNPSGLALDSNDDIYIADGGNNKIKAVCRNGGSNCTLMGFSITNGNLAVVAGNGTAGLFNDTKANIANQELSLPDQLALSSDGTKLYIADTSNHVVRLLQSTGITTFYGSGGSGDPGEGVAKASASASALYGVALDSAGNVIVADTANDRIKIVYEAAASCAQGACPYGYYGTMTKDSEYTLAGTGASGYLGTGYPTQSNGAPYSKINNVRAIAFGPDGTLYFSDGTGAQIRALMADSTVSPCASVPATCNAGYDIVDIVGDGTAGETQGVVANDQMKDPQNIVADTSGNVYAADPTSNTVREYIASTGEVRVVAGTGTTGTSGDAGPAVQANITIGGGIALDGTNQILYITAASKVRAVCLKLTGTCSALGVSITAQNIDTVAGTGTAGTSANATAATSAKVNAPQDLAWDATNSKLYIADTGSDTIKVVYNSSGWKMDVFAGTSGTASESGDGSAATSATLSATVTGVAVDSSGNVYIADAGNQVIRKVTIADGKINRIAGQVGSSGSTEGAATTVAKFSTPADVAVDSSNNVFIADSGNQKIRELIGTTVSSALGTGTQGYANDDGYFGVATIDTPKGVYALNSNLFVAQTVTGSHAAIRVAYGLG